jgi:Cu/Ag efflux pump CusA
VEVLWWIESVCALILVPTPGIVAGVLLSVIFVPILFSYKRHGRTLGPIGYWYSVLVVNAQAFAVIVLPLSSLNHTRDWLGWAGGSVVAAWLGVSAWFASEPTSEVAAASVP